MKKLPPIIITIIVSAYISIYIGIAFFSNESDLIGRIFLGAMGVGAIGLLIAMIATLIIRLKEIYK